MTEREREGERESVCVCERESVCERECERECERRRERESKRERERAVSKYLNECACMLLFSFLNTQASRSRRRSEGRSVSNGMLHGCFCTHLKHRMHILVV